VSLWQQTQHFGLELGQDLGRRVRPGEGGGHLGSKPTTLSCHDPLVESEEGGGVGVQHRVRGQNILHQIWPAEDVCELDGLGLQLCRGFLPTVAVRSPAPATSDTWGPIPSVSLRE
jgi:hypothetical protein